MQHDKSSHRRTLLPSGREPTHKLATMAALLLVCSMLGSCRFIKFNSSKKPGSLALSDQAEQALGGVPLALAELRERHAPPDVDVHITKTKRHKTIACGHSPLCALALPIIALDMAFPDEVSSVVVTEKGEEVWRGHFDKRDQFVSAVVRSSDGYVRVQRLHLRAIGRTLVVVTAQGESPKGMKSVPLKGQIDVLGAYRDKLTAMTNGRKRRRALLEALPLLGEDIEPLLVAEVKRGTRADNRSLFGTWSLRQKNRAPNATRAAIDALVTTDPDAATLIAALGCLIGKSGPDWQAGVPIAKRLLKDACDGKGAHANAHLAAIVVWAGGKRPHMARGPKLRIQNANRAPKRLPADDPGYRRLVRALKPVVEECKPPAVQTLMAFGLGLPVTDKAVLDAIAGTEMDVAWALILRMGPNDGGLLLKGLGRLPAGRVRLAVAGLRQRTPPDTAELKALTSAYLRLSGPKARWDRAMIVERMAKAKMVKRRTVRPDMTKLLSGARGEELVLLRGLLAVLGQPGHDWAAARGLRGMRPCVSKRLRKVARFSLGDFPSDKAKAGKVPHKSGSRRKFGKPPCVLVPSAAVFAKDQHRLTSWVLKQAGCSTAEIVYAALHPETVAKMAMAKGDAIAGALCQGRKNGPASPP
ncbi:MAG: hypothetical protein KC502_02365 [Myxococcales bacterium]|nr:hypothetical protein [Myxococcales bacterium]